MFTTLKQSKDSRIAKALGYCSDSDKFLETLNEAQERLMNRGKWVGTYGRFTIVVTEGMITWPRQVLTPEGLEVCGYSVPVKNEWFDFVPTGPGLASDENKACLKRLQDKGTSPLIADISGTKKLKIYIDNAADAGKKIFFKGKDSNGNKIYKSDGQEGFEVTLANPSVLDAQLVTEVYGVIKDATVGAVRVYQYNTSDASQSLIAIYEPSETTPCYRRSFLTGLSDDPNLTVVAFAKRAFIPAVHDTDFLAIGNIPALKEMCVAVKMGECEKWAEAEAAEARALRELDKELTEFLGDSSMPTIQVQNADCPVENLI